MKILELNCSQRPSEQFERLAQEPFSFFLDSSANSGFSFWSAYPYKVVNRFETIEQELSLLSGWIPKIPASIASFPFVGGAVGFISYEAVRQWEPHLHPAKKEPFQIPDVLFGLYDTFFAFDHATQRSFLISFEGTPQSTKTFERLKESALRSKVNPSAVASPCAQVQSNMSYPQYAKMIRQAKTYIQRGEIYQVNLSQCLHANLNLPPYTLYQKLRVKNPANFSAYLNFGDTQILSSSPERFLSIDSKGIIYTEPIKGTIRRGQTPEEDQHLRETLLNSEKNRAELMMIVDLERNDLGKICDYGSVQVTQLYGLESYATVHHLVSKIRGRLKTQSLSETIKACFPGGSITGAPKLRAMQIIDELEPHNRGIYTGSIGYIDYRRQLDMNIAIRTIVHQKSAFYFPVGGGIVVDSDPKEEYQETLHKGEALISAISKP